MADDREGTEAPSQRRLEKAREDGNVPFSREIITAAILVAGMAILLILPHSLQHEFLILRAFMFHVGDPVSGIGTPSGGLHIIAGSFCRLVGLCTGIVWIAIMMAGLVQTSLMFRFQALVPDFKRISPASGIKKLISLQTGIETLKTVTKTIVFVIVLWIVFKSMILADARTVGAKPLILLSFLRDNLFQLCLYFVGMQIVIAGADYSWTRFHRLSKLKMTRQELKDEYRETEGDPHIKGKLKQIRASLIRHQLSKAMKTATVVVTNPTHYAVALKYDPEGSGAPIIVAKGMDDIAARIRELARDYKIPIVPNPPLARALHAKKLESQIPAEHFQAVAAVIAYVWRLKRQRG